MFFLGWTPLLEPMVSVSCVPRSGSRTGDGSFPNGLWTAASPDLGPRSLLTLLLWFSNGGALLDSSSEESLASPSLLSASTSSKVSDVRPIRVRSIRRTEVAEELEEGICESRSRSARPLRPDCLGRDTRRSILCKRFPSQYLDNAVVTQPVAVPPSTTATRDAKVKDHTVCSHFPLLLAKEFECRPARIRPFRVLGLPR